MFIVTNIIFLVFYFSSTKLNKRTETRKDCDYFSSYKFGLILNITFSKFVMDDITYVSLEKKLKGLEAEALTAICCYD